MSGHGHMSDLMDHPHTGTDDCPCPECDARREEWKSIEESLREGDRCD